MGLRSDAPRITLFWLKYCPFGPSLFNCIHEGAGAGCSGGPSLPTQPSTHAESARAFARPCSRFGDGQPVRTPDDVLLMLKCSPPTMISSVTGKCRRSLSSDEHISLQPPHMRIGTCRNLAIIDISATATMFRSSGIFPLAKLNGFVFPNTDCISQAHSNDRRESPDHLGSPHLI